MSQSTDILNYLERKGAITSLVAIREFGCTRLAARIKDLERKGWQIPRETIEVSNRYGKACRVTKYKRPIKQRSFIFDA